MQSTTKALIAEFIGTFALIFFGCGSIIVANDMGGSLVTVALAFGLVLAVFVPACMYISGAQFNPAVSVALTVIGKQDPMRTAMFIAAQLIAAGCGAGMLVVIHGEDVANSDAARLGASLGSLSDAGKVLEVFLMETLMTFALMFVVLAGVVDGRAQKYAGVCVGGVVAACVVTGGPLTGASMNPARSFGPALYGNWDMHWVYWAAPILGACLAAVVYKLVWEDQTPEAADGS
ncbi:MAG: aquaporin [Phycisphaera sp.]|nr:MAG: aquaporin [Phycisphaera sp.]